jgi:hypothetical protein
VKYGNAGSWAVWAEPGEKVKSNIADMSVLDPYKNALLLSILHTNSVMVGLNCSRKVSTDRPFTNFHDPSPRAQDYKIRHAFRETAYYGSYMTDLIKDFPMLSSKDVLAYLRENPSILASSICRFKEELEFIGAKRPVILIFGKDTYNLIAKNLGPGSYSSLHKITHYSHHISQEAYREQTLSRLGVV